MEKINYQDRPNCYRLSNENIELIMTTDIGPRIIRFGFVGQQNEFAEFVQLIVKMGGNEWRGYGGHRLWHAPEARPRSYIPDNNPITIKQHADFIRLTQSMEAATGIQKEIDLYITPDKAQVAVVHRLYNHGLWDVELAPWAISMMAPGGKAIIPLLPCSSSPKNLLPASMLAIWPYTDLSDPRWIIGRQYTILRQDKDIPTPQKAGTIVSDGWVAYYNKGHLFVKTFNYMSDVSYPDFGCSVEIYTNNEFLELETLGPLALLKAGKSVEHVEKWFLFRDITEPYTDSDIEKHILPLIRA